MGRFYTPTVTIRYPSTISLLIPSHGGSRVAIASVVARRMKAGAIRIGNYLLGVNVSSLVFVFVILIAALVISNLVLANNLSTKGEEVRVLENQKAILAKGSEELRNEIAHLSSLSRIKKDAAEQLGMVEAASTALDYLRPPKFAAR